MGSSGLCVHLWHERFLASATCWLDIYGGGRTQVSSTRMNQSDAERTHDLIIQTWFCVTCTKIPTDVDTKLHWGADNKYCCSCGAYLSLMETRKSLGVEEKSSKLAMSSCFTWMGSQSSMMNLRDNQKQSFKHWLQETKARILSLYLRVDSETCVQTAYQILLLQGFSMYKSMFSISMAEVLCINETLILITCFLVVILATFAGTAWDLVSSTFASGLAPRIFAPHSTEA